MHSKMVVVNLFLEILTEEMLEDIVVRACTIVPSDDTLRNLPSEERYETSEFFS